MDQQQLLQAMLNTIAIDQASGSPQFKVSDIIGGTKELAQAGGLQLGSEDLSQVIAQGAPGFKTTLGEKLQAGGEMLLEGIGTGIMDVVKTGQLVTGLANQDNPEKLEQVKQNVARLDQQKQEYQERVRGDSFRPQSTLGQLGEGLLVGVGDLAPEMVLAGATGGMSAWGGGAKKLAQKFVGDMATSDTLWKKAVGWSTVVAAEEAGVGTAIGLASIPLSPKVAQKALENDAAGMVSEAAHEMYLNTVMGAVAGLGIRGLGAGLVKAKNLAFYKKVKEVQPPGEPALLDQAKLQADYVDPVVYGETQPVRELLRLKDEASRLMQEDQVTKLDQQIQLQDPALLQKTLAVKFNEANSLVDSYFKPLIDLGPGSPPMSLAQYFRESRFSGETFTGPEAHRLFLSMEQEIKRQIQHVEYLLGVVKENPVLERAYREEMESISRQFTLERQNLDPTLTRLLEKQMAGEKLTPAEMSVIRASTAAEQVTAGDFAPDSRNKPMALLRARLFESHLTRTDPTFDFASTVTADVSKLDLEGMVKLFQPENGNGVNWGRAFEKLVEMNPEGFEQMIKAGLDESQFVATVQDAFRRTFAGPEGTRMLREALGSQTASYPTRVGFKLREIFPDIFGDINVVLGDEAAIRTWQAQLKGPLDFAASVSKDQYQMVLDRAYAWVDRQVQGGMAPKVAESYREVLHVYDVLAGRIGRKTGAYQSTAPLFGDIPQTVPGKDVLGDWSHVSGQVLLDQAVSKGPLHALEVAIHEHGHGLWAALPKEVKAEFAEMFHQMAKEDPTRFSHVVQKSWSSPGAVVEATAQLGEIGADYMSRGLVAFVRGDVAALRQFTKEFPMHRRTQVQKALTQMSQHVKDAHMTMHPVNTLLKALDGQLKLAKIMDDPVYGKWVEVIKERALPDEVTYSKMAQKPSIPLISVTGQILPKGAFDQFARLTTEGEQFVQQHMNLAVPAGTPLEEVGAVTMEHIRKMDKEIQARLPEGSLAPNELYLRASMIVKELAKRIEPDNAVGEEFRRILRKEGVDYIEYLNKQVLGLGSIYTKTGDQALAAYSELERIYHTVDKLRQSLRGRNPRLWDEMDSKYLGSWSMKMYQSLRGKPIVERLLGPESGVNFSKLEQNWHTAQFAAKKEPVIGGIADIWIEQGHKSHEFQAKILQNDKNILGLAPEARPLEEYLTLGTKTGKTGFTAAVQQQELRLKAAVDKMLLLTNEHVNQKFGRGQKLAELPSFTQDAHGNILEKGELFRLVREMDFLSRGKLDLTAKELEAAYQFYQGINGTRRYIMEDQIRTLEMKIASISDPESVAAMRLEMGRLVGSIPQYRSGSHVILVKSKDGKQLFTQFFDGSVSASITGTGEGAVSTAAKGFFGKKNQSGMKWAQEEVRRMKEEGAPEWGLAAEDIGEITIARRNEVPKDVYFGASPTHLDAVIKQAMVIMEKDGVPLEKVQELRKYMAESLAVQTRQGGFLSKGNQRMNVPGWETQDLALALKEELAHYSQYRSRTKALDYSLESLALLHGSPGAFKFANELIKDMAAGASEYSAAAREIRNLSYWTYMAGRMSTAAIQIAGNFFMAVPRLGIEGVPRAARQVVGALGTVRKILQEEYKNPFNVQRLSAEEIYSLAGGKISQPAARALHEATLMGATWSSYIDTIMKAESKGAAKVWHGALDATSLPLRWMEELNRRSTFLVAFEDAFLKVQKQLPELSQEGWYQEAMNRALKVTMDSHIDYSQVNLPSWARGPQFYKQGLRVAYTLKNFSHNYAQLLGWMMRIDPNWKSVGESFGYLGAMGGLGAIPFVSDIIAPLVGSKEGVSWNERLKEKGFLGKLAAGGPLAALGITDLSLRLNPFQATMMGATTMQGMYQDLKRAKQAVEFGDWSEAMRYAPINPAFLRDLSDVQTGVNGKLTSSGKVVSVGGRPVKYDFKDAVVKALGFKPENAELAHWYRQEAEKRYWNEQKATMAGKLRTEFTHNGKVSPERQQEFMELRLRAAAAGFPMQSRGVGDIVGRRRLYQDHPDMD